MMSTKIEWAEDTLNIANGCARVSPGCQHCYAEQFSGRFSGEGGRYQGLVRKAARGKGFRWTGKVRLVPEMLSIPLRRKKPTRFFVCSMGDLFHKDVPFEFIAAFFGVAALTPQHTYMVLTKRPERMREFLLEWVDRVAPAEAIHTVLSLALGIYSASSEHPEPPAKVWPLPNIWLGTSVEDQAAADKRLPHLRACPAAVRWVSAEPLLGPVDLSPYMRSMGWLVCGGESGNGARPMDLAWARSLRDQCQAGGAAFFFKQLGKIAAGGKGKGGDLEEIPEDLRVREFPVVG